MYVELDSLVLTILQSVESAESKCHRKVMKKVMKKVMEKVMKKDILAVVDTATRSTKQFFLLFRKGVSLIWLY